MNRICAFQGELPQYPEEDLLRSACPVAAALEILESAREQLCGKGVFCRDGMAQLRVIVSDVQSGKAQSADLELLEELCGAVVAENECVLSVQTAGELRRLLLDYRSEWLAHIIRRKCSAGVCPGCRAATAAAAGDGASGPGRRRRS